MSIPVSCSCGQQFMAQPHLAGKQVACPSCGKPLSIPAAAPAAAAANIVTCACGKSFKAPPHLAGQRVACPDCGQPIDIPSAGGREVAGGGEAAAGAAPAVGGQPAGGSDRPAAAASPAAGKPRKKAVPPAPAPAPVQPMFTTEDTGLAWDDSLATPDLNAAMGLPAGPVPGHRRVERETIEPMTMYAIWAGIGAVALLVLLILGHILWNAFSSDNADQSPPQQSPPADSAPAEPTAAEPAAKSSPENEAERDR